MKKLLLILCLAFPCYAADPSPAPPPAAAPTVADLTKERDALKAEVEALKVKVDSILAEANARITALEAQRNDALNQVVTVRAMLATQKKP